MWLISQECGRSLPILRTGRNGEMHFPDKRIIMIKLQGEWLRLTCWCLSLILMLRHTCRRQSGQWWRRWKCIQYLEHSYYDNCCAYFCKHVNNFFINFLLYRPRTSSCPQCSIRTYVTWMICIILMCHTSDLHKVNLMLLMIYTFS